VEGSRVLRWRHRIKGLPLELLQVLSTRNSQLSSASESHARAPVLDANIPEWKRIYASVWKRGRVNLKVKRKRSKPRAHALTAPASIDWERRMLTAQLWSKQLELPLPGNALRWLKEREREVAPLKPAQSARFRLRGSKLEVQLVLKVRRPQPEKPDPRQALLVYVRAHSYGFAVVFASYDGKRVKVNERRALVSEAARAWLRKASARAKRRRRTVPPRLKVRRWVEAATTEIFEKAWHHARGRSILMNIDVPRLGRNALERAVLSIGERAKAFVNWYGVYAEHECYPSRRCPLCGRELRETRTLGHGLSHIVQCECGFYEDENFVPFYHWLKELGLPLPSSR